MTFKEVHGNLFDHVNKNGVYAHCIAQDGNYGAGIAPVFVKFFKQKKVIEEELAKSFEENKDGNIGFCILSEHCCHLITKAHTHGKPTYTSLSNALVDLRDKMIEKDYKSLYMPKIGCGLDQLSWPIVKEIITEVFGKTDINITIKII